MRALLFTVMLSGVGLTLNAQQNNGFCATPDEHHPWFVQYQSNPGRAAIRSDEVLYLPMTIYYFSDTKVSELGAYKEALASFCTLKQDMAQSGIQFYLQEFIPVVDSVYNNHGSFSLGREMIETYNTPNTINSYITTVAAGACGYVPRLGSPNMVLAKGCNAPSDHTWAHEVGHAFILPHTFSGTDGSIRPGQVAPDSINGRPVERVDGSNCLNAGDSFCDTPPDYISNRWTGNSNCRSISTYLDPDSTAFRVDGSFFMSYVNDDCMTAFSAEQTSAMRNYALDNRADYTMTEAPFATTIDTEGDFLIRPFEGDTVQQFDEVVFEWESVPGATEYLLQVSILPNFAAVRNEYRVSGNTFTATDLLANKRYYWRLRPLNPLAVCPVYTAGFSFRTGRGEVLTNTTAVEPVAGFTLRPNPVAEGGNLQVGFISDRAQRLELSLHNLTGQQLQGLWYEADAGVHRVDLPISGLPSGIYLVRMESATGQLFRRVVVE